MGRRVSAPELDDVAARALASIILERTADTLHDGGEHAANALLALASDSGLMLDIAAGLLMATAWLAGAGALTPEAVFAASVAMQPDEDETIDGAPSEGDQAGHVDVEASAGQLPALGPLPTGSTDVLCHACQCPAVGVEGDRFVCFHHYGAADDGPPCPNCSLPGVVVPDVAGKDL